MLLLFGGFVWWLYLKAQLSLYFSDSNIHSILSQAPCGTFHPTIQLRWRLWTTPCML